jgi:hypothetical protein
VSSISIDENTIIFFASVNSGKGPNPLIRISEVKSEFVAEDTIISFADINTGRSTLQVCQFGLLNYNIGNITGLAIGAAATIAISERNVEISMANQIGLLSSNMK